MSHTYNFRCRCNYGGLHIRKCEGNFSSFEKIVYSKWQWNETYFVIEEKLCTCWLAWNFHHGQWFLMQTWGWEAGKRPFGLRGRASRGLFFHFNAVSNNCRAMTQIWSLTSCTNLFNHSFGPWWLYLLNTFGKNKHLNQCLLTQPTLVIHISNSFASSLLRISFRFCKDSKSSNCSQNYLAGRSAEKLHANIAILLINQLPGNFPPGSNNNTIPGTRQGPVEAHGPHLR